MSVPAEKLRRRKRSLSIDKGEIFTRINSFYEEDRRNRDQDRDARLERYAKFRMWVERKDWPWEDASNVPLSDMLEQSLRTQDTIHNAVMSSRPVINATATQKHNREKEEVIDNLADFQFFEESPGETIIGDAADAFVNDGVVTLFIPWIKEMREVTDVRTFDPIPPELGRIAYFRGILNSAFPGAQVRSEAEGWDFIVETAERKTKVQFYIRDDDDVVEMFTRADVEIFNGPRPMVIDYEDILYPIRAANLQIPGPSNPGGAAHVILEDHPSIDEIKRLQKNKFYDLLSPEDMEKIESATMSHLDDEEEDNRDIMNRQNIDLPSKEKNSSQNKLTRWLVFDTYDIDGDGIDEDVIFWVIMETKSVAKAVYLGEMYPLKKPTRPFAESTFIPIRGRRIGISLLEILEGLHDVMKSIMDQAVDAGTISNVPFFFYRAVAGMRPEVLSMQPGDGYPVADPQRDINFPQIGNPNAQNFALNMITTLTQMEEKATVVGDIQLGRVPPGRSSALRTASGLALLSGQGEARPERLLRRFFIGLSQAFKLIHGLNEAFLPKGKQYMISGFKKKESDPYRTIDSLDEIRGEFNFGFKASVLNTSKQGLQESLEVMMNTYVSDLAIQLGIIDADGIYRLMRDFGRALGQDADAYLREPAPGAGLPKILAEEAISMILQGSLPTGNPQEGAQQHMQKLMEFANSDELGVMDAGGIDLLKQYLEIVNQKGAEEAQRQELLQAASQFQVGAENQGGRPPEGGAPDMQNPQVNNELLDETLTES